MSMEASGGPSVRRTPGLSHTQATPIASPLPQVCVAASRRVPVPGVEMSKIALDGAARRSECEETCHSYGSGNSMWRQVGWLATQGFVGLSGGAECQGMTRLLIT